MGIQESSGHSTEERTDTHRNRKRLLQEESSSNDGDESSDGSQDHCSRSKSKSRSRSKAMEPKHTGAKRAARNTSVQNLLGTSQAAVTLIYVVLNGVVEARTISNVFTNRKGEEQKVWAPTSNDDSCTSYRCTVCRKSGEGEGGRFDAASKGFDSKAFQSKMKHNKYRTHANKLISKLPRKLEDGAEPVVWQETWARYSDCLKVPLEGDHGLFRNACIGACIGHGQGLTCICQVDVLLPQWFHLAKTLAIQQLQAKPQLKAEQPMEKKTNVVAKENALQLRKIDCAFLTNYFSKKLQFHKRPGGGTNELMVATSELIALQAGASLFETLEDLCELDCGRQTRKTRLRD